mgnify:CR=1 FL=1
MKFEKALDEATESTSTSKKEERYYDTKKKAWVKKTKRSTGVTSAKTGFTGATGDQESLADRVKSFFPEK